VVVGHRIAQIRELARRARKVRFNAHDRGRIGLCLACVVAEKFQHPRDVLHVLVTDVTRVLVRIEVVVAIGQTQATLVEMHRVCVAVLLVLEDQQAEKR
jgi:hypothetical protein